MREIKMFFIFNIVNNLKNNTFSKNFQQNQSELFYCVVHSKDQLYEDTNLINEKYY